MEFSEGRRRCLAAPHGWGAPGARRRRGGPELPVAPRVLLLGCCALGGAAAVSDGGRLVLRGVDIVGCRASLRGGSSQPMTRGNSARNLGSSRGHSPAKRVRKEVGGGQSDRAQKPTARPARRAS